jgi:XTP/dITP diphosphohydrolase
MDLIVATHNPGKVREIAAIFAEWPVTLRSLEDFPDLPEVVEDGTTFAENAIKKACAVAAFTGCPALADDSGLEVDALRGAPGVYSARFGGPDRTDAERNALLLERLRGVPTEGHIALEPRGTYGFGYDPLFEVAGQAGTMAELPPAVKNRISHRARALQALREVLSPHRDFLSGKP